jgi:hypothetical protein
VLALAPVSVPTDVHKRNHSRHRRWAVKNRPLAGHLRIDLPRGVKRRSLGATRRTSLVQPSFFLDNKVRRAVNDTSLSLFLCRLVVYCMISLVRAYFAIVYT